MSQENIEVVRASFEAWNARDMDAYRMGKITNSVFFWDRAEALRAVGLPE